MQESHQQSEQALYIEPTNVLINEHMAWHHMMAREYDRSIPQALKTIELDPDFVQAHRVLALDYLYTGRFKEACAEFEKGVALSHEDPIARAYQASHGHNEARRLKLKSPPRLLAQGSEREQRADNDPERAKDSDCVCRPMQALSRPALLCASDQSECFEKKNRKYARHQIQNDSTGKRKRNCERNPGSPLRLVLATAAPTGTSNVYARPPPSFNTPFSSFGRVSEMSARSVVSFTPSTRGTVV